MSILPEVVLTFYYLWFVVYIHEFHVICCIETPPKISWIFYAFVLYAPLRFEEISGGKCAHYTRNSFHEVINMNSTCCAIVIPYNRVLQVVHDFERRKRKIEELGKSIELESTRIENYKKEMEVIRSRWIGPLQELIENINKNFSNFFKIMRCSGEVDLKVPDNPVSFFLWIVNSDFDMLSNQFFVLHCYLRLSWMCIFH